MTLPRSVGHEYDQSPSSHPHMSNSLDKRTYVPGFMGMINSSLYQTFVPNEAKNL